MDVKLLKREKYVRSDGYLVELFSKKYGDFNAVHSYLVSIEAGKSRAGHFHKKKNELIFPVDGEIVVLLSIGSEKKEIRLASEENDYVAVIIPPNINHLIENRGDSRAKMIRRL